MALSVRPVKVHGNPHHRKKRAAKRRQAKKRNPGMELVTVGFLNPAKGRKMAKTKKKRAAGGFKRKSRPAKKHNPFKARRKSAARSHRPRRRRNPSVRGFLGGGVELLKSGVYALIGLVLTRQLPQLVLGARNTGVIGYLANVLAAGLASAGIRKGMGPEAGNAALLGGGLYLANRVISEWLSPVSRYLSLTGLGDPGAMIGGPRSLRGIESGYFPLPVPLDAAGRAIIPSEIRPAPPVMLPAPAAAGMGRLSGAPAYGSRFGSRFGG